MCLPLFVNSSDLRGPAATPPTFRADSTIVFVRVTVTDPAGRPILTLNRDDFRLTEDGRPQEITSFFKEDSPVSIAIVVDLSNSMARSLNVIHQAVAKFLRMANAEDEFCLIELHDEAALVQDFGVSTAELNERLALAQARGHTALLDGLYLAVHQMKRAHNFRKAVLVISDGGDNHSRFRSRDVKNLALESDAAIYAVEPSEFREMWSPEGTRLLEGLAQQTGGRDYQVDTIPKITDAAQKIGIELRSQYVLGYLPRPLISDGKYHRLGVQIVGPAAQPKLSGYWRRGYYAPGF